MGRVGGRNIFPLFHSLRTKMVIPVCTRRFGIDVAHRVLKHESKCRHLHGHRLEVEITCASNELDHVGRVIDFGRIKEIIGTWLDENLDHNSILNRLDPLLIELNEEQKKKVFAGKNPYILDGNPTVENLTSHLLPLFNTMLEEVGVTCTHIRIYETPNCWADYDSSL